MSQGNLRDVLRQHAGRPGEIMYRSTMAGRLESTLIEKHSLLLRLLRESQTHIAQSVLEAEFYGLAEECESEWHLASEKKAYAETSSRRVRAMLRDISQNLMKYKGRAREAHPSWLREFVSGDDQTIAKNDQSKRPRASSSSVTAGDKKQKAKETDDDRWVIGYEEEMQAAWRMDEGMSVREYCDEVLCPESADSGDECVAIWRRDGMTWRIPSLLAREWRAQHDLRGCGGTSSLEVWWHGVHEEGDEVELKDCKSKARRWIILWHPAKGRAKKQRAQMSVELYDEATLSQAVAWMTSVAKDYAKNKITIEQVRILKDEFVQKKTEPSTTEAPSTSEAAPKRRKVMRKPAAAQQALHVGCKESEGPLHDSGQPGDDGGSDESANEGNGFAADEDEDERQMPAQPAQPAQMPSLSDFMPPGDGIFGIGL